MALLLPALAGAESPAPRAERAETGDPRHLDALHARRDDAALLKELEARLAEALKRTPGDYEVLWRAARARSWAAESTVDAGRKKQLAKEAWALAEKAIAALPDRPEGHLFAAVSIGGYAQAVGILAALSEGLEARFNERLDRALALDPDFNHGIPVLTKGRYFYELPWPRRNLHRSAELLQQATQRHPVNLRAWLYLAETQLAEGDVQKARASLERVLQGSTEYDPPEARRVKVMARSVQAQVAERLK